MKYASFLCGFGLGIIISVFVSTAQEFVLEKKEKKVSVSCQQCVESLGEYEHIFSDFMKELSHVFVTIADINGYILAHIDKYVDSSKDGFHNLSKTKRVEFYQKIVEICTESREMLSDAKSMRKKLEKQLSVVKSL